MNFHKYQHIERLYTDEVEGLTEGNVFVFPKLDGTNGSVWWYNHILQFGSRNRDLEGEDNDNAAFKANLQNDERYLHYFSLHPGHRLFGEWLVPHTLKTYTDSAWRKFYIFDVMLEGEYIPYTLYRPWLEECKLDYIPLLAEVRGGTKEQFYDLLEKNTFLIRDGMGVGEGIVIKDYDYRNRFGRATWGKLVRGEFKTANSMIMGAPIIKGSTVVEAEIVEKYITGSMIDKEVEKISLKNGGWSSKLIPQLLGVVFYTLIAEESWNFLKDFKYPDISYKLIQRLVTSRIKTLRKDIFA